MSTATTPTNIILVNETDGLQSPIINNSSPYYYTVDMTPDGRLIYGGYEWVGGDFGDAFVFRKQLVAGAFELPEDWSSMTMVDSTIREAPIVNPADVACRVVAITDLKFRYYYKHQVTGLEVYKLSTDGGLTWGGVKDARPLTEFTPPWGLYGLNYTEGNTKRWVNHRRGQITYRVGKYYYRQLTDV